MLSDVGVGGSDHVSRETLPSTGMYLVLLRDRLSHRLTSSAPRSCGVGCLLLAFADNLPATYMYLYLYLPTGTSA